MNLVSKLLSIPLMIWLVDFFTPLADYFGFIPYVTYGILIGGIGWTTDELIMPSIGNLPAVLLDVLVAGTLLWFTPMIFPGSVITWGGIGLLVALIAVTEYLLHRYLVLSKVAERVE